MTFAIIRRQISHAKGAMFEKMWTEIFMEAGEGYNRCVCMSVYVRLSAQLANSMKALWKKKDRERAGSKGKFNFIFSLTILMSSAIIVPTVNPFFQC